MAALRLALRYALPIGISVWIIILTKRARKELENLKLHEQKHGDLTLAKRTERKQLLLIFVSMVLGCTACVLFYRLVWRADEAGALARLLRGSDFVHHELMCGCMHALPIAHIVYLIYPTIGSSLRLEYDWRDYMTFLRVAIGH